MEYFIWYCVVGVIVTALSIIVWAMIEDYHSVIYGKDIIIFFLLVFVWPIVFVRVVVDFIIWFWDKELWRGK